MDYLVNPNDIWAPLDGEFFGRPTRQTAKPFGAIGTGRFTARTIPNHPLPIPTLSTISPTDFAFPTRFRTIRKANIGAEVVQEKLNATLRSRVSPPPQVKTLSPPPDNFCLSDVFDENEPPAMTYQDVENSDSSDDLIPSPGSRMNRMPFGVLFVERQPTRRVSQESGYTDSPPSKAVQRAILGPQRAVERTSYEKSDIAPFKEAVGSWGGTKTKGLARIRTKAPQDIDIQAANKSDELPNAVAINPANWTAADILIDILSHGPWSIGPRESAGLVLAPFTKVPLPISSSINFDFFDDGLITAPRVGLPMTPHRQVLLDILNA
jgi:hypothetical protein